MQHWPPIRAAEGGTIHFVVPTRLLDTFEELAEGAAATVRSQGLSSRVQYVPQWRDIRHTPGDTLVVFGGYRFDRVEPPADVLLVGLNSEQFEPGWTPFSTPNDRFLACCDVVLAVNECLLEECHRLGEPAEAVLPFGYTPTYEGPRSAIRPLYDIAFLGRVGPDGRRDRMLRELGRKFRLHPETRAFGSARFQFLAEARIQLSLHQYDKPMLPAHRFALCFANETFLLSEPLPPAAPFQPGVHFAEAREEDLPDAIARYLDDDVGRQTIARQGQQFFRDHYRLDRAVLALLPRLRARPERSSAGSSAAVAERRERS